MINNIYTRIEEIQNGISGWCSVQKARTLASLIVGTRPELTVEIGVWFGKSLIPMALAHQHILTGKVMAIDPWKSESSILGQVNPQDKEWWDNQNIHDQAYRSFKMKIEEFNLSEYVEVIRKPSNDVNPPDNIGLLSVDGNHGEQAIDDIKRYAPKVKKGGFIVADDIEWTGGSVSKAISMLPAMGYKELYRIKNPEESWAVFQRL